MTIRTLRLIVAAALSATPLSLAAQDFSCDKPGDVEVRSVSFAGNHAYSSLTLSDYIATTPSSMLWRIFHNVWGIRKLGAKRCLDPVEFRNDVIRLRLFYSKAGFAAVQVDTTVERSTDIVKIRFTIHENAPTILQSLKITGLEAVPERREILADLPLRVHERFERDSLTATVETLRRRLRDNGYPGGDVFPTTHTDTARHADVEIEVDPGARAYLRSVSIEVTPRAGKSREIPDKTIRRLVAVDSGDLYRERQLQVAKRNLYLTDDYQTVVVDVDSADVARGDSSVGVHVKLIEGTMRSSRASVGWGQLDCFRSDGSYRDNDFLRTALRFDATASLSKIGIGRPLGGAAPLCGYLRDDPYSVNLNYAGSMTFSYPTPLRFGMRPSLSVYSERHSEYLAYLRTVRFGTLISGTRASTSRRAQTFAYQFDYGRTEAAPAVFCALQNLCLPADRDPLLDYRGLAVASWSVSQDWSDNTQFPTRGGVGRLELRHASRVIGSDPRLEFNKATADLARYTVVGNGIVLAARLRGGAVVGPSFLGTSKFIPQQERLFAGGGNTVRGFSPNDLGPKVYIVPKFDTVRVGGGTGPIGPSDTVYFRVPAGVKADRSVPTGGSALVVANVELRLPSAIWREWLQWVVFADAGELWSPGSAESENRFRSLKVTPGAGLRVITPVGPIRLDIGLNTYAPRPGAAYFDTPITAGGQLYCVSPGNTLGVTGIGGVSQRPVQASGPCAADFRPQSVSGLLRRLTFSFGIGQAY